MPEGQEANRIHNEKDNGEDKHEIINHIYTILGLLCLALPAFGQDSVSPQTDQQFPGIDSKKKDLQKNDDGSITVYFGPKAPAGKESNWVQTLPGKSSNLLYRMYGPLEAWFDKTWELGDFELTK